MKLNPTHQNILNTALIITVIIIAFAVYQTPKINVHGVLLPQTDKTFQSANPENIQVVTNVPLNGQYIGLINTSLHYANNNPKTISNGKDKSLVYAKQLAANAGGNSIIIGYNVPEGPVGPLDSIALRAYVFKTR